jgi:hypothetical protein
MFAVQFGIPALGALVTKMDLIFYAHQFGGLIRMIHTNVLWFCIHFIHYDINSVGMKIIKLDAVMGRRRITIRFAPYNLIPVAILKPMEYP